MSIMVHRLVFPDGLDWSTVRCTFWWQPCGCLDERLSFFVSSFSHAFRMLRWILWLCNAVHTNSVDATQRASEMLSTIRHVCQSSRNRLLGCLRYTCSEPITLRSHAHGVLHDAPSRPVIDRLATEDVPHQTSRASEWARNGHRLRI